MTANPDRGSITQLLCDWTAGDSKALDQLTSLVYDELHRLARSYMARERSDHTLQTTALINEAYIRLIDGRAVQWKDRAHFFAVCAKLMRRILVDFARARRSKKRADGGRRVQLTDSALVLSQKTDDILTIDQALNKLAAIDARGSQIVELRFFGGLTLVETAEILKLAPSTVLSDYEKAREWLWREISGAE